MTNKKREEELAKTLYEKPIAVQLDTILSIKQRPTSNWKEGKVTF